MAAARRAYWKGYLKLSLVTCPIALYPASSDADKAHFHQINRKTGHRLRQQMVDEVTGKVVDKEDKSRGYEVSKGKYVEVEPEEIKAIASLSPCCRFHPAEVEVPHQSDFGTPCCLRPSGAGSALGSRPFEATFAFTVVTAR